MSQEHHPSAALGKKNRLASSQSPYLLQHAENPVDWYPWGPEAFERAKAEDKPIFLSIGYSTCHWCHVMAHESFEDEEVARLMNETFVSIKVDREERPDIDGIYMTVCQMMTQRGGWPLTVVMTPDQKPFLAGTYFPKESRFGRVGMTDLVPQIKEIWENRREEVYKSAEHITEVLGSLAPQDKGEKLLEGVLPIAYQQFADGFDEEYGGFGGAPKFPTPHNFSFLLRYGHRFNEPRAIEMVERTLQAMRRGGIYDHLGFGFHRYSTDREWLLPHFEKMLYDQALLAMAFIETYQVTGKEEYRRTAEEIFEYVLRDMTSPEGGFYSAEDADSEGEEGKFYVWTEEEIRDLLEEDAADRFIEVYSVQEGGNFLEEATGRKTGANILHLAEDLDDSTRELLEGARKKLFEAREKRIHPYKDDKILIDWNGLMIAALAKGARVFQEPRYAEAAGRAADFILEKMRAPDKGLLHRFRNGEAGIEGLLDDYAFFIHGLIHLYEATFDVDRLQTALALNREMIGRFWDEEGGAFFFTASDSEKLIVRRKEIDDGALPSGNSVAMLNLLRLSRITGNTDLEKMAETIGAVFSGQVSRWPRAFSQILVAVDFGTAEGFEVVVAGRMDASDTKAMIRALAKPFLPHMVLLFRPEGVTEPDILKIAEFAELQTIVDGRATAYVCSGFTCEKPTTDPIVMLGLLGVK